MHEGIFLSLSHSALSSGPFAVVQGEWIVVTCRV